MKKIIYLLFIFLFSSIQSWSQETQTTPARQGPKPSSSKKKMSGLKLPPATGDANAAKDNFTFGNYRAALSEYLAFLQKEPKNPLYLYKAGLCYLNGNIDFPKAVEYIQKSIEAGVQEKDAHFQLGRAQHLIYKFDDAIKSYEKGIEVYKNKELEFRAKRNIEMCKNAKILMKNPVNVTIENLGPEINSPEPDYYPFVDDNETTLFFSTRRTKGNQGYVTDDGYVTSDIFIAYVKDGKWQKAKPIGPTINTPNDEEIIGLVNNGETIFLNLDSWEISGDVLSSEKKGKQYQPPVPLPTPVNTEFIDMTLFATDDKNTLYFASDRPGGYGGTDLYVSKKLPSGEWSPAYNLGANVNSEYNEYFPMLNKDGKILYFSSEGHNSMGGFDIFKSDWSETDTAWAKPINIGYPINTPDDDMEICFNALGTEAYISSFRKGSLGDLDIYSVRFNDAEANATVIKGKIYKMIPIDYADNMTFHFYEKEGEIKKFPESWLPKDTGWVFKEKKTENLKPGHKFSIFVTLEKDGEAKKFPLDKIPNDSSYVFKDIKVTQTPVPNYKAPAKAPPAHTKEVIMDASLFVAVKSTGITHGEYLPNPNSGKYIIIVPPGEYTLTVAAPGFKDYSEDLSVIGKGSFEAEIEKNIILKPEKPIPPIHYSKLKEK